MLLLFLTLYTYSPVEEKTPEKTPEEKTPEETGASFSEVPQISYYRTPAYPGYSYYPTRMFTPLYPDVYTPEIHHFVPRIFFIPRIFIPFYPGYVYPYTPDIILVPWTLTPLYPGVSYSKLIPSYSAFVPRIFIFLYPRYYPRIPTLYPGYSYPHTPDIHTWIFIPGYLHPRTPDIPRTLDINNLVPWILTTSYPTLDINNLVPQIFIPFSPGCSYHRTPDIHTHLHPPPPHTHTHGHFSHQPSLMMRHRFLEATGVEEKSSGLKTSTCPSDRRSFFNVPQTSIV